eukprot:Nk52_evm34s295 gene=Nk52_evmTU34s295
MKMNSTFCALLLALVAMFVFAEARVTTFDPLSTIQNVEFDDIISLDKKVHQQISEFERWAARQGKEYTSAEIPTFQEKFEKNKEFIDEHNKKTDKWYELELNEFADYDETDFKRDYLSSFPKTAKKSDQPNLLGSAGVSDYYLPEHVDWRDKNVVIPPKNQGKCGSCWTFAAIAALESHHALRSNELIELSEQQILDCASNKYYGNMGCGGGTLDAAYAYVKDAGGVVTEQSYPYKMVQKECNPNPNAIAANISHWTDIPAGSEDGLKRALALHGPVAIAIHVSDHFKFYKSGVYHEENCPTGEEDLNHAVTAVGYGTENGKDYWLIKNSWGNSWGLGGYVKIARNAGNMCGVASMAVYPNGGV